MEVLTTNDILMSTIGDMANGDGRDEIDNIIELIEKISDLIWPELQKYYADKSIRGAVANIEGTEIACVRMLSKINLSVRRGDYWISLNGSETNGKGCEFHGIYSPAQVAIDMLQYIIDNWGSIHLRPSEPKAGTDPNTVTRKTLKTNIVLLVEDDLADITLVRKSLQDVSNPPRLYVVKDGAEALDFLFKRNEYQDAPTPDMVLLDLNMPRVDGVEVLREIKANNDLRIIPVVILTTSDDPATIRKTRRLHANAFITKPFDLDEFMDAIRRVYDYWTTLGPSAFDRV